MGKRKAESGGNRNKKYKVSGFIDPNTSGVYATCNRGREQGCRKELMNLFSEKIDQWYPGWEDKVEDDEEEQKKDEEKKEELSVEEKIKQELAELNESKKDKKSTKSILQPMDLGCECLVFIKTKKPVDPAELVHRLCEESAASKSKNTRYTQKLTPISYSVSASMEELVKLAEKVLKPHFHADNQKPVTFAIQVTRRNFNTLEKDDIIKTIANCVGRDHGHKVDLKKYDKLIMVECYKNNIGMSVVDDYLRYEKFNLQQIFEKDMGGASMSRVAASSEAK
ncbi:CIC11C00000004054 [Sungouiella intermedia]|uniref:CIC11C00000004054 n=1 Tax=Sungouiella intermedia TaxID=45354 RepID=A0A1L0B911_9ASCO|nr:CIC11C00000004054 [[Candida] intermedia]